MNRSAALITRRLFIRRLHLLLEASRSDFRRARGGSRPPLAPWTRRVDLAMELLHEVIERLPWAQPPRERRSSARWPFNRVDLLRDVERSARGPLPGEARLVEGDARRQLHDPLAEVRHDPFAEPLPPASRRRRPPRAARRRPQARTRAPRPRAPASRRKPSSASSTVARSSPTPGLGRSRRPLRAGRLREARTSRAARSVDRASRARRPSTPRRTSRRPGRRNAASSPGPDRPDDHVHVSAVATRATALRTSGSTAEARP